jgi:methionyl-tRNA formyltransferase
VSTALLKEEAGLNWARQLGADWLLCINSTVVLPAALIALFEGRALNCHPGPLPEYAGLHVHQWAIRNGETEFGVTLHRMEAWVDTGPIMASRHFPIRPDDTGLSLFRRAMSEAADLAAAAVGRIASGDVPPCVAQDLSRRRLYRHRDALDGRIDWQLPRRAVMDFIRAGNYEPFRSPTFVPGIEMPSGVTVEVLRAESAGTTDRCPGSFVAVQEPGPVVACGDGQALCITRARDDAGFMDNACWHYHLGSHPLWHPGWPAS